MKLLPYQVEGAAWLAARKGAGLWDEMGLGKTATSIAASELVAPKRLLVVAPASLLHNWKRELGLWAPRRCPQVLDTGRARISPLADCCIVSQTLLDKQHKQLCDWSAGACIIDEAHNFRSPTAQRTHALFGRHRRNELPGVVHSVDGPRWCLTGTPMPNGDPGELWTALVALDPERVKQDGRWLGYHEFRERFCDLIPPFRGDKWKVRGLKPAMRGELHRRLDGFGLRRMKKDHLQLPPLRWGHVTLDASELDVFGALKHAGLPEELLHQLQAAYAAHNVDRMQEALRASEHLSTFRRVCGLLKVDAVTDYVAEELCADRERKLVIFVHHLEVGAEMRSRLHDFGAVAIHGGVAPEQRQRLVDQFQRDPRTRVAVCQLVAGGVGITLTAAHDVIFVEQSWVPGDNLQAADRCHRIGQTRPVLARVFSLADSIDELISDAIYRKTALLHELLS